MALKKSSDYFIGKIFKERSFFMKDFGYALQKPDKIFTDIVSLSDKITLSKYSRLTSASKKGLVFYSKKKFFPMSKRELLRFLNQPVELFLSPFELSFFGVFKSISEVKKDKFKILVDFTKETPLYYRECIEDLLN